jgi:hypothetical protein
VEEIDEATGAAVLTVVSPKYGTFRVLIDVEDWERVAAHTWSAVKKGKYFTTGVRVAKGHQQKVKLHRFIMYDPAGIGVDHRDPSNTLDNRKSNLRVATQRQNAHNSFGWSDRKHKYKGVYPTSKNHTSWMATIMVGGQSIYLGAHHTEEIAARIYDAAALCYHGEFAQLNFPLVPENVVLHVASEDPKKEGHPPKKQPQSEKNLHRVGQVAYPK